MRETLVIVSLLIIIGAAVSAQILILDKDKSILTIFHAGSLSKPMADMEKKFEEEHPNVDVRREVSGSTAAIRKVTELGKNADVVMSADYSLIQTMMVEGDEKYADYCIQFARNQMVLAYTDRSAYLNDINTSNWFEILMNEDVRFGFSNPNDDPCGYRALMTIQLAEIFYGQEEIFDDLVEKNCKVRCEYNNGTYKIAIPKSSELEPENYKFVMRDAEIYLMTSLELGEIDYLFIYRSIAYQFKEQGVKYLELPSEIDLSDTSHEDLYERVRVITSSGRAISGKTIIYGVTIPRNAENPEMALEFIKMLLGETGRGVMESRGQRNITPAICGDSAQLPYAIKSYVE